VGANDLMMFAMGSHRSKQFILFSRKTITKSGVTEKSAVIIAA
jgi:hypothetical protein